MPVSTPTEPARRGLAARVSLGRVFAPVPSEFLLIASTAVLLTIFGLVMVLSATSAVATAAGQSPYDTAMRQAMFAAARTAPGDRRVTVSLTSECVGSAGRAREPEFSAVVGCAPKTAWADHASRSGPSGWHR